MSNQRHPHDHQNEGRGFTSIAKAIREHAATTQPETSEKLDRRDRKHLTVQWVGALLAGIYAGLTLLLLLATKEAVKLTGEQVDTAKMALDLTRRQVHVGQRAYLAVDNNGMRLDEPAVGKKLQIHYEIKNTGQTPAVKIHIKTAFKFSDGAPTLADLPTLGTFDIGAGQSGDMHMEFFQPLTAIEFGLMNRDMLVPNVPNGRRLYLYGLVTYKDVFDGDGETEFCTIYLPPSMHTKAKDSSPRTFTLCGDPGRNRMK